jgi:hypothetical protein
MADDKLITEWMVLLVAVFIAMSQMSGTLKTDQNRGIVSFASVVAYRWSNLPTSDANSSMRTVPLVLEPRFLTKCVDAQLRIAINSEARLYQSV